VRQDVRVDVRKLAQVMETVRLQRLGVEVAERREASTALQLSMGRSQIRDYTDAVNSLNDARNALTRALIDHHIGELELSRDIGLIELRRTDRPVHARSAAAGRPQGRGAGGRERRERGDQGMRAKQRGGAFVWVIVIVVLIVAGGVWLWRGRSTADSGDVAVTWKTRKEKLRISVIESGQLKASKSTDIYCEVKGGATILFLIPEGRR
jgi:hypothetical protein